MQCWGQSQTNCTEEKTLYNSVEDVGFHSEGKGVVIWEAKRPMAQPGAKENL